MKKLLILAALSFPTFAQTYFIAQKTTVLSGAAEVITIQQPASNSKVVRFISAYIDCSVACTATIERNGTVASSTTLAPVNVNPNEPGGAATAWSSSNVGTGTVLHVSSITAGGYTVFDLNGINMPSNNNTGYNLTLRTSSITGTVHITIKYSELL